MNGERLAQAWEGRGRIGMAEQMQRQIFRDLHSIKHRSLALGRCILFLTAMPIIVMRKAG
jgi:hypothetical protein